MASFRFGINGTSRREHAFDSGRHTRIDEVVSQPRLSSHALLRTLFFARSSSRALFRALFFARSFLRALFCALFFARSFLRALFCALFCAPHSRALFPALSCRAPFASQSVARTHLANRWIMGARCDRSCSSCAGRSIHVVRAIM